MQGRKIKSLPLTSENSPHKQVSSVPLFLKQKRKRKQAVNSKYTEPSESQQVKAAMAPSMGIDTSVSYSESQKYSSQQEINHLSLGAGWA